MIYARDRLVISAFFVSAFLTTSDASAQDRVVAAETKFRVQTSSGQPKLCSIEYTQVYHDDTYRQGAQSIVTGSLSWGESKGNFGLLLKAVGADIGSGATMVPFAIAAGFLAIERKPYLVQQTMPCEQPHAFCGLYGFPVSGKLLSAAVAGQLSLNFNRSQGGMDISLPLNTKQEASVNPQVYPDFLNCIATMAGRAKTNLRK